MQPTHFDALWSDALFFSESGLNVTLKPQSDPLASKVVDGYSVEQLNRLRNSLPALRKTLRLKATEQTSQTVGTQCKDLELWTDNGEIWYLDQAERLNAFNFNRFQGWTCESGFRSIVITEPGGKVKRSYSCKDQLLGTLDDGFSLFEAPRACITPTCVSSADSKIPKYAPRGDAHR
jgi:hypothetical protein